MRNPSNKPKRKRTAEDAADLRVIFCRLLVAAILLAVFVVLGVQNSRGLEVSRTRLPVEGLPQALRGLRVAEIADLHSSRFGEGQSELIAAVKEFKPDLILIAGDFTDGVYPNAEPCEELVKGLLPIAPVYRVRGNHEYYLDAATASAFDASMAACGAILLDNSSAVLSKNGQKYLLSGMDDVTKYSGDPRRMQLSWQLFGTEKFDMETAKGFMKELDEGRPEGDYPLQIMLCHQPAFWQLWQQAGYDVALCGHLHGWLFRIPGIGGFARKSPSLYFPEEDSGLYDKHGLLVYISRGLDIDKRLIKTRLNNQPELSLFEVVAK